MPLRVIVKNTFLDLDEPSESFDMMIRKRSSSLPRTWKLRTNSNCAECFDKCSRRPPSVISTSASDGDFSDAGSAGDIAGTSEPQRSPSCRWANLQYQAGASAGNRKELYMRWDGKLAVDLALPRPSAAEQRVSDWTKRLNPAAAEFKMPPVADIANPAEVVPAACPPYEPAVAMGPPMASSGAFSAAPSRMPSPSRLPSPPGGGSRLNPKARAFEPGAASFVCDKGNINGGSFVPHLGNTVSDARAEES